MCKTLGTKRKRYKISAKKKDRKNKEKASCSNKRVYGTRNKSVLHPDTEQCSEPAPYIDDELLSSAQKVMPNKRHVFQRLVPKSPFELGLKHQEPKTRAHRNYFRVLHADGEELKRYYLRVLLEEVCKVATLCLNVATLMPGTGLLWRHQGRLN